MVAVTALQIREDALEVDRNFIESGFWQTDIRVSSLELANEATLCLLSINDWVVFDVTQLDLGNGQCPLMTWHRVPVELSLIVEVIETSNG